MKPKILIILSNYLPSYKSGGPIRSIANIVQHLNESFIFDILTRDREIGSLKSFENIQDDGWNIVNEANVKYIKHSDFNFQYLQNFFKNHNYDILYLNSFFSFRFAILPLIIHKFFLKYDIPIVLAPRGQFSIGALKSRFIPKHIFLTVAKCLKLYGKVVWHATNPQEAEEIIKIFTKKAQIKIASNLLEKDDDAQRICRNNAMLTKKKLFIRIIFISGIVPKKNLHVALMALSKVNPVVSVKFDVYGPVKNRKYFKKCQKIIEKMPKNVKVKYNGSVENKKVGNLFRNYDMFFFPTEGENFGHAIIESLQNGCPALISNTTPWNDIAINKAGWVYDLKNKCKFTRQIELCASFDVNTQKEFSENAVKYAMQYKTDTKNVYNHHTLFRSLLT